MNRTTPAFALLISLLFGFQNASLGQEPEKYALLIAVKSYEQPEVNSPALNYTEIDAQAVGDLLKKSGYVVDLVVGSEATSENITKKLEG